MNKTLAENEIKRHGSLTKEEINVLFSNDEEKPSQEEKSLSDYFNEILKLDSFAIQKAIQKTDGQDFCTNPTLISKLLQYTPANLALNLIDGSNYQKGDVLIGAWQ